MCAVTAAKLAADSDLSIQEAAKLLSDNYRKSYDDKNLEDEIATAASKVTQFMESVLPNSSLPRNLTQIQYSIVHFEPNGSRRKKKLFGGTWFNKERTELPNKIDQCAANVATYHLLIVGGSLPLAPDGWSL